MKTSIVFQHMKIIVMLFLAQGTLVRLIICWKYLNIKGNKGPIHTITRPPNQYPNYKTSIDIKPMDDYKGSTVIFDDILGARNSSQMENLLREEDMRF